MADVAAGEAGVFNPSASAGRRWCMSADHHEWLHMLLDRAKKDLKDAYAVIASQPGGDMSWLAHFDAHDQAAFVGDLLESADDPAALTKCLRDWRVTAEALSDPARREVLTGTPDPADFTEVQRPGGEDA